MKNLINKKFLIIYSILISLIFLSLCILYILCNIERTAYLSSFKKVSDNNYNCKINYYDNKFFKNNKIFMVYPYFNYDTDHVLNQKNLSYKLTSYNNLDFDDKIDIQYKLKLKKEVFIFFIFIILIFPIVYLYIIPNIINNYKIYILLLIIHILLYFLLTKLILPLYSMLKLQTNIYDILYSYLFIIISYNLLSYIPNCVHIKNHRIIFTILFCIITNFSFFVIEIIALSVLDMVVLFSDMPNLYSSLITVLTIQMKIITIISSIIYFSSLLILLFLFIYNLYKMFKMKKLNAIMMMLLIISISYILFLRPNKIEMWSIDFLRNANKRGIIYTLNYRINYDRMNNIKPNKELVLNSINLLKTYEEKRDLSNLLLQDSENKRDIFLIFLESFYDYSHFVKLFNKDPFPREYRKWANSSKKIAPNVNNGSFYARLSGLTASSPLYPKTQSEKIDKTLIGLLNENGYCTLALEEALNTYNLKTFYPSIGFSNSIFGLNITNINKYLETNINNLKQPLFVSGFTILGHTDSHIENDFNIAEKNKKFMNYFNGNDRVNLLETIDNSVMTSIEIIKIRDTILKHSPNALIIFKHDHLYPYLRAIVERSTIDENIKRSFLEDNSPSPILIWDGTNGAYKPAINLMPENIPMFIAINAGVTNYKNSVISLLYKEEINNNISTYHKYYKVTNNSIILENNVDESSEIFKYENAQKILSQDIFQGKKYYYELISDLENN
ncbi:hypothetical protein EPJ72_11600 [Brachyspira pilosicoli]|uniref:Sulfatase n=1 Tax=Brachyspira pilosicoli TaxID=52584 RepID=A0A5C8EF81_BRAPL|nr:hypothetical protein EPJ72_11600 [Brachyspira pilosicoli]